MKTLRVYMAWLTSVCLVFSPIGLEGCSSKDKVPAAAVQQAAAGQQADQQAPAAPQNTSAPAASGSNPQTGSQQTATGQQQPIQLPDVDLSPAGLDELLAPIALYPDPVLAVVLQSSVDPQQVMDGGNWLALDQNQNLKEAALDQASQKAGFTPVMQALLHYPSVVDMMCTEFDWTKQLGAAYSADPKSVLGSVQRLRAIAVDNGALKTSSQMKVNVKQDQGQDIVEVEPANPKVVYVPSYDPQRVFSTTTTTTNADGSTTTTTTTGGPAPTTSTNTVVVQQQKSGVSTESAVLIGLLSFGAGIAVGAAINNNNYYYPSWGYGGVYYGRYPYYPPPYRPYYGPGWGPSYGYGYNRPVHYGNNNIYISNTNNYYNRFNNNSNMKPGYKPMPVQYNNNKPNGVYSKSMGNQPGSNSGVKYNRPNNGNGNGYTGNAQTRPATQPARPGNAAGNTPANNRPSNTGAAKPGNTAGGGNNNWKGQTTYQGNRGGTNGQTRPSQGNAQVRPGGGGANAGTTNGRPGGTAPGTAQGGNKYGGGNIDRGYGQQGGGRPNTTAPSTRPTPGNTANRPATGNTPATRPAPNNQTTRPTSQPASRPQQQPQGGGAFGGANNPSADRAASNRGRASMGAPQQSPGSGNRAAGSNARSKR